MSVVLIGIAPVYSVGLDLATNSGVVVLQRNPDGEVFSRLTEEVKVKEYPEDSSLGYKLARSTRLAERVVSILSPFYDNIDVAVVEAYGFASKRIACAVEIGTLVRYLLSLKIGASRIQQVAPAALKKWATGKGNTPKEDMKLKVFQKWGFEHLSSDVVDAYALARYGLFLKTS